MTPTESLLPEPTADPGRALENLRRFGVALLEGAFRDDGVRHARQRLDEIAERERAEGIAICDDGSSASGALADGANQRVLSLITKDAVFRRMATTPALVDLAGRLFAGTYRYPADVVERLHLDATLVSSVTANIAWRGGQAMELHSDQGFVPPTIDVPIILNVIVPLVDFTADNGATRVSPGSHLTDPRVLFASPPPTTPVLAPAGTAILIDGRTWHGTGANRTDSPRPAVLLNYCPPWVRPFETHGVDLTDALGRSEHEHDLRLRALLGSQRWFVYGAPQRSSPAASMPTS